MTSTTIDHPRYATLETLGQGAQGVVVRVVDRERPGVPLVAKVARAGLRDADDTTLRGELAILSRVRSRGLVRVHDFTRDKRGVAFLVEDFVEGDDAVTWVSRATDPRDRVWRLLVLGLELTRTLRVLHDAGVVHGDVKPKNIRATSVASLSAAEREAARIVLLDLGAAAFTRLAAANEAGSIHTPAFAAPEVCAGAPASPAADVFSLGRTLAACAVGRRDGVQDGSGASLRDQAPWVPSRVGALIDAATAKHPADRPRAEAIERELRRALREAAVDAPGDAPDARHAIEQGGGAFGALVRERELTAVQRRVASPSPSERVIYVMGAHGSGKSHLLRELALRMYLEGRGDDVRVVSWRTRETVEQNGRTAPAESTTAERQRLEGDEAKTEGDRPALLRFLRGAGPCPFFEDARDAKVRAGPERGISARPGAEALRVYREKQALPSSSHALGSRLPRVIVLDDVDRAPVEVREAIESYRCRAVASPDDDVLVVAGVIEAPLSARAVVIELAPLDDAASKALLGELGVEEERHAEIGREAGGQPGWLFAALGRCPLTRDAAIARVGVLREEARQLLGLVATLGGQASLARVPMTNAAMLAAECFEAGLLTRSAEGDGDAVRLTSPHLAGELASALASYALSDMATEIALVDPALPSSTLAAIARSSSPPSRRHDLLVETGRRAAREGARATEIEALVVLASDATSRTAERVLRLERLLRDAGRARSYPQILGWLDELSAKPSHAHRAIAPLAERRRAEDRARAGEMDTARAAADRAIDLAKDLGDDARVYAHATRGAIALWSAEWSVARDHFAIATELADAFARRETGESLDAEEIARLEHNLGVVELYRNQPELAAAAFERSTRIKRALGDRVGVRACLLNLGLALTRIEPRWPSAEAALVEGMALAESLEEPLGRGWCLAALADLAVRRRRAREAERHVAEAESLGDVVPKTVRADLVILRAQIALLDGDARCALGVLTAVDADIRRDDALVDARVSMLEARALLACLPVSAVLRRRAAKKAIASIRRARGGELPEAEEDAIAALRAARRTKIITERTKMKDDDIVETDMAWSILDVLASAAPPEECIVQLARAIVTEAKGERVVVARIAEDGDPDALVAAWGIDLDGLPLADAAKRVDADTLRAARRSEKTTLYQPEIETAAGVGSRLAVAGARAAIVIEHRFRAHAFDHLAESQCKRWLTIADIALRIEAAPASREDALPAMDSLSSMASLPSPRREPQASTALPRRDAPLREYPSIVGRSPSLRRALAQLDAATEVDLPVLIEGETGTGKELFARALHDHGARRDRPFVAVNCAAIADSLFEAELFGHARGAFTGADRARPGLLARAEGGTLLLDEMGELALPRQATLLRALEEHRYRPVGSDDERPFDVRIVAATNRDLDDEVRRGHFRKDLLYRLRVLRVVVPPLREREGDIELLLRHFFARAGSRAWISPAALERLESYAFPGNVRELSHLAQRLVASGLTRIDVANLPREVRAALLASPSAPAHASRDLGDGDLAPTEGARAEVENALAQTGGNISRAAGLLGITRHGLKKRMLRLGLRAKREVGS